MSALSMMRNTCTIERSANTQSTYGTAMKTYTSTYTGVACSVQINSGSEGNYQQRLQGVRQLSIFFPAGTDVIASDRIKTIAGVSGIASGDIFEVTSPPEDHAGRNAYVMVSATEINE